MTGLPPSPRRALRGYARLVAMFTALAVITVLAPSTGREVIVGPSMAAVDAPGPGTAEPGTIDGPAESAESGQTGAGGEGTAGTAAGEASTSGPSSDGGAPATGSCTDRPAQIHGDPYSPPCIAFTGDNGGETSTGVTADTITLAWRMTDETAAAGAVASAVGSGVEIGDSREDVIRTLNGLTDYINAHFQLYGRKIDLQIYDGLGSNADENGGIGQDKANSDAVTAATEIGAFADVSAETAIYTDALVRRGVIAVGMNAVSDEWYEERHPFAYGILSCSQVMRQVAELANKRLFGRPASDAGGDLAGRPRRIALIAPENPWFQDCVKRFVADTKAAGNQVAEVLTYATDLNTLSRDTSSMVARLVEDEITSVVLFTDPITPLFLTAKATQQRYFPEWIVTGIALTDDDRVGQFYDQAQWEHAFGLRTLTQSFERKASIPYAAFKSMHPDQEPAGLALLYSAYVRLYSAAVSIQLAGPNLTPETFAAGWQSYTGGSGFAGTWRGAPGSHTFQVDAEEAFWDPNHTSPANGAQGGYVTTTPRLELGEISPGPPRVAP